MIDENRYTIYTNKDGRQRVYDKQTHSVLSYPRLLMQEKLGRALDPNEDVHHIDENPSNNSIDNLQIIQHGQHQRRHSTIYFDKMMICPCCSKQFVWTARQQSWYYGNMKRRPGQHGPFCSKSCCGKFGRNEQLRRNAMTECS